MLLLTLKSVTMTSAYLKDWMLTMHFITMCSDQWEPVTDQQLAMKAASHPSLELGELELWKGGAVAAFPCDTERCSGAVLFLLFLLCCLPSLLPKGKAEELCPCPVPLCCPRPLPARLAAKADRSVVEHLSWQWEKSCPSFLLHICWVRVCLPPQLETLVYIV